MRSFIVFLTVFIFLTGCQVKEDSMNENKGQEQSFVYENNQSKEEKIEIEEEDLKETERFSEIEETLLVVEEKYQIDSDNWKVKPLKDGQNDKIVLLTIDDAPDRYSVDMAKTLKELEAGAIFFVNGHFLQTEEDKQKLKTLHQLGFEIGNHTMNHPNMSQITAEEQRREIVELNDLVEEIIGERPRFYRAPFGVNTTTSKEVIEEENMLAMNWTYGYDWEKEYQEAKQLAEIMINTELLSNGANILMHDRSWTLHALEDIVTGLRKKGYEPVDPKEITIK
ncbi:polysaccharide deacetylase family protein [Halalkalibacter akibai]|uniref:Polysaccharide deacetylase n=1 Tax=Halalkalibacter akibai (strain ATCC 43226 / DSM 21942 / CIP 109018 / JCM 9157 / 1139) TaxID=1236973 RepID=W4QR16_HALA3|nr:polysaccharide deacetylase family protein [Halalkalibacter akibai]GAE33789.1 polysaccharide deacetylase [Halalkalibacter akibai JCM 9157]